MEKETRNALQNATQRARALLTQDFEEQLEGDYDVLRTGMVAPEGGSHLTARQRAVRPRIVASIEHKRAGGMTPQDAVQDYLREAAFTTLNRFAALKMMEARGLVLECVSRGDQSSGYAEFTGTAPGVKILPDGEGYRLFIECIFDELSTEVKVLFDRRDAASTLWPKRSTFEALLDVVNASELASVWGEDETIGWIYQYFNSGEERRAMREASQTPRNSRELAVRNQFFTPDYVVRFLVENTLGRLWYEMRKGDTQLKRLCDLMVWQPGQIFAEDEDIAAATRAEAHPEPELQARSLRVRHRPKKDPRNICAIDPACGSGHFLLGLFSLYLVIYEEAWADENSPPSEETGRSLHEDYPSINDLRSALPGLILQHNLYGVDIDPRCAQIAQLALWMRAQRAYSELGVSRSGRSQIRRSNIVVAEPLIVDAQTAAEFVKELNDAELERIFSRLVEALSLAGDMGLLLPLERMVQPSDAKKLPSDLFRPSEESFRTAIELLLKDNSTETRTRRRLFADDATHGILLSEISHKRFDVVLMNPPFGAISAPAKKMFEASYPKSKGDMYAAFVDRGIDLLSPQGRLGAITSRTGFFLSSFRQWREEVVLRKAPPQIFVDLGAGVLDSAMVETAAYCLELQS